MEHFQAVYETAIGWTKQAGEELKAHMQDPLNIEYKTSAADLVTDMDKGIEAFFIKRIKDKYPNHYIFGEEGILKEEYHAPGEIVWLIDPIDGTTSFVHQRENFAISVALFAYGKPIFGIIYDPMKNECFHALVNSGAYLNDRRLDVLEHTKVKHSLIGINSIWLVPNEEYDFQKFHSLIQDLRGTRIIGSAALEMAAVACGRLNGFICLRLSPWDYAAGIVILNEVGATVTTINNQSFNVFEKTSILAANPSLHSEILKEYLWRD